MQDLYSDPVYNSLPVTYNFDYEKTIEWDLKENMPSYQLKGPNNINPLESLRVNFFDGYTGKVVPAVYCTDYYAKEIAAEQSGQSDSTFYSETYADSKIPGDSKWIYPNLTETKISKTTISDSTNF